MCVSERECVLCLCVCVESGCVRVCGERERESVCVVCVCVWCV